VASRDGRDGSLRVHQDCDVYAPLLAPGAELSFSLRPGRHAWLQVVAGELSLGETPLAAGDGAAISGEPGLALHAHGHGEALLFDLR
jgi:redox-sensitive bicupin YhaK (pirin superfamily)